jgi:hypothetical protein
MELLLSLPVTDIGLLAEMMRVSKKRRSNVSYIDTQQQSVYNSENLIRSMFFYEAKYT